MNNLARNAARKGAIMKPVKSLWLAGLSGLISCVSANAAVTVTFVKPESYVDMPFMQYDKDRVMKELDAHFNKLGARLPAGQDLKIDVLDIDLAGRMEPQYRGTQDVRILRGTADWPTIELRYRVESKGAVIKSGQARVNDMNYLRHRPRYDSSDLIRYEKQMLDDWFARTLLGPTAAE
jgi:hypothetical protein